MDINKRVVRVRHLNWKFNTQTSKHYNTHSESILIYNKNKANRLSNNTDSFSIFSASIYILLTEV